MLLDSLMEHNTQSMDLSFCSLGHFCEYAMALVIIYLCCNVQPLTSVKCVADALFDFPKYILKLFSYGTYSLVIQSLLLLYCFFIVKT